MKFPWVQFATGRLMISFYAFGVRGKIKRSDLSISWFKERGQWADGSFEPAPGMIIFFDWDSPDGASGPQDGLSDHVGIVQKVENGYGYTIEGNYDDSCAQGIYSIGYFKILGYGILAY